MIARVIGASLLAGLLAGLLVAALQHVTTTPLILEAEKYEVALLDRGPALATLRAEPAPAMAETRVAAHEHGGREHGAHERGAADEGAEWKPEDGWPRTLATSTATVGAAIGFAALLLAGMLAAGDAVTERAALAWGVCGFIAFGLAPAAGLAPELPGSAAGPLVARQIWWISTACLTAGGLFAILRSPSMLLRGLGVAAILLPHVVGAPRPDAPESHAPAEIAAHFTALSLVIQATLWLVTALFVGTVWRLLGRRAADAGSPA